MLVLTGLHDTDDPVQKNVHGDCGIFTFTLNQHSITHIPSSYDYPRKTAPMSNYIAGYFGQNAINFNILIKARALCLWIFF